MSFEGLLEEYFAANPGMIERDRTRTTAVIEILTEKNVEQPSEHDYKTIVIPEIMKKYPRVKSEDTAGGYVTCARKFLKWVSTKGDKTMDLIPIETETKNEGKSAILEQEVQYTAGVTESIMPTDNEATADTDMAKSEDTLNSEDTIKSKDTPKRTGKNGKEQISLYVDSCIYAKLKEIAQYKKMTVSEILCTAMKGIVDRNYEKVQRIQQYIESEKLEI